jgi:hypothetical protein
MLISFIADSEIDLGRWLLALRSRRRTLARPPPCGGRSHPRQPGGSLLRSHRFRSPPAAPGLSRMRARRAPRVPQRLRSLGADRPVSLISVRPGAVEGSSPWAFSPFSRPEVAVATPPGLPWQLAIIFQGGRPILHRSARKRAARVSETAIRIHGRGASVRPASVCLPWSPRMPRVTGCSCSQRHASRSESRPGCLESTSSSTPMATGFGLLTSGLSLVPHRLLRRLEPGASPEVLPRSASGTHAPTRHRLAHTRSRASQRDETPGRSRAAREKSSPAASCRGSRWCGPADAGPVR